MRIPTSRVKRSTPTIGRVIDDVLHDPARRQTTMTLRWIHPDGRVVWAEHRQVPVYDASGQLVAIEGIARDVTELVESQRRLRESEEQMRQLAARLQTAREEERAQVARELHDELGQTLTAIKLEIGRDRARRSTRRAADTDDHRPPAVADRPDRDRHRDGQADRHRLCVRRRWIIWVSPKRSAGKR